MVHALVRGDCEEWGSKQLAPEYERAASMLDDVALAKVDAEQNRELASRFEIRGYPTLKFFREGKARAYDGKRSAEEIILWVREYAVPVLTFLKSADDVQAFRQNLKLALVYYAHGEQRELDQVLFESQAELYDGVHFAVAQGVPSEHKVVLFTPDQEAPIPLPGDVDRE